MTLPVGQFQVYVKWQPQKGLNDFPYSVKIYNDREFAQRVADELNRFAATSAEYSFEVREVSLWRHMAQPDQK